jgi:ubiquinol-cytochrome c reductase cytochrome b subunit
MITRRISNWVDERFGSHAIVHYLLKKIYPDHWSFYLGEFALYCFIALVATGIWLTFAFQPDEKNAFGSVLELANRSHPIGYLIRQVHHWAANTFIAAILVHMGRIFFTGAFRKPREINWMIGFTMLLLASLAGFTGYSLPNDDLSGTGLRIAVSVALSVPFVGRWAAAVFNGADYFPGPLLESHLYTWHVYFLPIAIAGLLTLHIGILTYQKHTQFTRDPHQVVGRRFWPDYALRTLAVFGATLAVLVLMASLFEINPVEKYGEYHPWIVAQPAVPDWYAAFLEGALRLGPSTEWVIFGHPIPPVFWPGVVLPLFAFVVLLLWPFIEARLTGDTARHDVVDVPSQRPLRMAVGAAFIFEGILLVLAAGDDQLAAGAHIRLETLVWVYRVLLLIGPFVTAAIVARIAWEIRERRHDQTVYPEEATTLVRNELGGFEEEEPQPV